MVQGPVVVAPERGRRRLTLGLLTAAFACNLLVNAVLFPPFRAPDEAAHIDMSRYVGERVAGSGTVVHPADDVRWIDGGVREAARRSGLEGVPADAPPLPADAAPPRRHRASFDDLGDTSAGEQRNQMTQHPPAAYVLTGTLAQGLERAGRDGAGMPYDLQVTLLRLAGALLVVPLPVLCALTARRLGAGGAIATGAALVPLGIPMLSHIGAAVNNDTLLIGTFALLTPLLLHAGRARRPVAHALLAGLLGGLALLTKGFGLVALGWVVVAFGAAAARGRDARPLVHGALAAAVALAVGGWWWLRNVVAGDLQPHHATLAEPEAGFAPDWGWWSGFAAVRYVRRFWIEPDTVQRVAHWEVLAALALTLLLALGGVALVRWGRPDALVVALFPYAALLALTVYGAAELYRDTGVPYGIHGRYTYPGLTGVAAVAAVGLGVLTLRHRWRTLALAAAVAAAQMWAWTSALRFYWESPAGGLRGSVEALLAWSPLPPPVVVGAAAGFWILLAVGIIREVRTPGVPVVCDTDRSGPGGRDDAGTRVMGKPHGAEGQAHPAPGARRGRVASGDLG